MRITTKGRYALRAMVNLALSESERPKAIKVIASEEGISPEFLEQIFFKLKKAGIISSTRGPGGGFKLVYTPSQINVKDIFLAVDEGLDITPCISCGDHDPEMVCEKVDVCIVHNVWREASEHINSFFEAMTLQKIIDDHGKPAVSKMLAGENVSLV